jgi:O-acetyl-ADP-ribose deacetylase (regulator of RNase III)
MPLEIVRNDITKMRVDAVVNAANSGLQRGGGVCGAIFAAAGAGELERECAKIGGCATGSAVITGGGKLPAKFIIPTVGPVWQGGQNGEEEKLRSCYRNSLELAVSRGFESVAFPLISSGIYGYPKDQALNVAVSEIGSFLLEHDIDVFLVVFDRDSYRLGEARYRSIQAFIDDAYAKARERERSSRLAELAIQLTQEKETSARTEAKAAPVSRPKAPPFFRPKASRKPEPEEAEEWKRPKPRRIPRLPAGAVHRTPKRELYAGASAPDRRARADRPAGVSARQPRPAALFQNPQQSAVPPQQKYRAGAGRCAAAQFGSNAGFAPAGGVCAFPQQPVRFDRGVLYPRGELQYFEINEALFAFEESLLGA